MANDTVSAAQMKVLRAMRAGHRAIKWRRLWEVGDVDPSRPTMKALMRDGYICYSDEQLNTVQVECSDAAVVLTEKGRAITDEVE